MVKANPQAIELNNTIKKENNSVYEILSSRGKAIFFPKKGILAQSKDAKGKEIDATIGIALEEDESPMRLKPVFKLVKKLSPEDVFPYAPSFGKKELRETWKKMIFEKNTSLKSSISTPVVTNALTHGLSTAGYLFINPGDKIILPDMFWGNYNLIFSNTYGAELDPFNSFLDNKFDINSFRKKVFEDKNSKQIILLNFPNNPTGYTPTSDEIEEITTTIEESAISGKKIVVLIDDAYFGLTYEEETYKESIFSKLTSLHKNVLAVKIDGATKEDYAWGFRVGFITFGIKAANEKLYEALENKATGAVRGTVSNVSHLSQSILLKAYSNRKYHKEKLKKYRLLKSRYKEVKRILENKKYSNYFESLPYNSGYFMCIKLNKGLNAEEIRQLLLEKYSTGVIALNNILRIAYSAVKTKKLEELFENIYKACEELKNDY